MKSAFLLLVLLAPASAQQPGAGPATGAATGLEENKDKPQLRLICITSFNPDHEVILTSRNDKGEWLQLGKAGLRASFISDWLPAKPGELHLAMPGSGEPKSICRFNYPADARRALVVLIADPEKKVYRAGVIDPDKMNFTKGSVLAINFSSRSGILVLGTKKVSLASGEKSVIKPALEQNGMYRMLVAYEDADRKPVPCYDRYVQGNPDSRDLLFLIPDPSAGLKVFSLPIFGSFD